ncbi:hypothetical protein DICPUDRAFT_49928 [Dictyostelium purpureum]|uniref:Uncharacterized protein n=1 Tax=Dictyostelium purpureum TaxID=5786 RepID=F0ZVY5_DICPU|nr:uncharacterized protein DICPUDRAFT_49928 [Dictyostelium purpureum]EGC31904.1 hypothetical protein DICPUDRAFT_49928 [Dictyostelium purpureum]|eukprot:XP_003291574.1 hypothetical protein DICPUDRAFT_49928 [Dictyostelium purpureum]
MDEEEIIDENAEEEKEHEDDLENSEEDEEEEQTKKEKKRKEKKEKKKKKKEKKEKKERKKEKKRKESSSSSENDDTIDNNSNNNDDNNNNGDNSDNNNNNNNNNNNEKRKINIINNNSGKRFDEWLIEESKKPIVNNIVSSSPSQFFNDNVLSTQQQIERRNNIAAIANVGDPETMYGMLQSMEENYQEIASFVEKRLNEKKSAFDYIKAVMKSTTAESDQNYQKLIRGEILQEFVKQIIQYKSGIEEKQLNQCVDILLSECDGINRQSYRDIAESIADTLHSNRRAPILLLLPKSLEQLSFLSTPASMESDESFKSQIIKKIVESEWNKEIFISTISMLNDLQLNKSDLELVINKIFNESKDLIKDEYISLVHQLILLSSKGLKGVIMKGICELFSNIEKSEQDRELGYNDNNNYTSSFKMINNHGESNNLNELFCVESIIFQQLNISIKQDMDLAKEYLKLKQVPTQFNIALLMNISRIARYKPSAFDCLKHLAIDFVKSSTSNFDVFKETINSTTKGLDIIVDACVQFAITLMDYQLIVVTDTVKALRTMGLNLLFELFSGHQSIRETILDEILSRIIMKSDTIPQNWFILLSKICKTFTADVRYSKLKESFEYLQHYSTNTVQQLVNAFDRIFLIQSNFLNAIIVVLKKSMFAREIEARSAGVTGFLQLLKCLSSPDAMSSNGRLMDQVILEIFGILRRALTQQESIRSLLYQGLTDLVSTRPDLCDHVFEMLSHQFSQYIDITGSNRSPFDLAKCVEMKSLNTTIVSEPLDKLIYCIQLCISKTNNINNNQVSNSQAAPSTQIASSQQHQPRKDSIQRNDLKVKFETFLALIRECSIESFQFSGRGTEAMTFQCKMLIGVMESLIEYISISESDSSKIVSILSLFSLYNQLLKKLKENQEETSSRSSIQTKQKGKSKAIDQDDENNFGDEDDDNHDGDGKSKKKPTTNSTTKKSPFNSSSNNSAIIAGFNQFPSLKCLYNLLKTICGSPKHLFNRNNPDHMELLYYSYSTLFNSLSKLYNGIKVLKKSMDKDQITQLFQIQPEIFFKHLLIYLMNEIMENEWVTPSNAGQQPKKPIHTIALSCIDLMVTFVFENKSEIVMYNIFSPILDNIRLKEYQEQLKEYQEKLKDKQDNPDEEQDQEPLIEPAKPTSNIRGHKVIVVMVEKLQQIITSHMFQEYYPDCELLFNVLTNLYKYLTEFDEVRPSFVFLKNISSKNKIDSPALATTILRSIIDMCNKQDQSITETLSKYVLALLGSFKSDVLYDGNHPPKVLALINEKTVSSTINILIENEESCIDKSKELISHLKKDWNGGKLSESESHILIKNREIICNNLQNCCKVLQHLSICKIIGSPREKFLKLIKKLYTVLTSYINLLMLFLTNVNDRIKELVDLSSLLSSNIYDFSEWRDDSTKKNTSKLNALEKARINREAKLMPTITFQLEKYESTVLKYQKKVKADKIRLGIHFKDAKSREFVIERQTLLDKMENNNDEDNSDNEKPSRKRKSTNISKPISKNTSKLKSNRKPPTNNKKLNDNNNDNEDDDYDGQNDNRIKKKQYTKKKY